MSLLIINTASPDDSNVIQAINELTCNRDDFKVFHTYEKNIKPCAGCYQCILKTPGICVIKDDHEEILSAYVKYDNIVFISDTSFDFIDSKTKEVVDRILPLFTFFTCYRDGETRHIIRYEKTYNFGLLYNGNADNECLNYWLKRLAVNINGSSLGAFPIHNAKELSACIL